MGIGEPLLNLENLIQALEVVREGIELGARKVTVSTVGFPDRLRRAAAANPRFDLAISLHSAIQEQQDRLMPAVAGDRRRARSRRRHLVRDHGPQK
ncbi:MAG: hypothetical protein R3F17_12510 [Planctomycetota bacterium]